MKLLEAGVRNKLQRTQGKTVSQRKQKLQFLLQKSMSIYYKYYGLTDILATTGERKKCNNFNFLQMIPEYSAHFQKSLR